MIELPNKEMPRYVSHKKVWALKIGEEIFTLPNGDVILSIADPGYASITIDSSIVSRYMPVPGDYYIVYKDGYKSISPAKAFEEGYERIY